MGGSDLGSWTVKGQLFSKAIFLETALPKKRTKYWTNFCRILSNISFVFWAMEFHEKLFEIYLPFKKWTHTNLILLAKSSNTINTTIRAGHILSSLSFWQKSTPWLCQPQNAKYGKLWHADSFVTPRVTRIFKLHLSRELLDYAQFYFRTAVCRKASVSEIPTFYRYFKQSLNI